MSQIKSLRTGIKFKDTPVGKIPVDWEATQLRRVGVLKGGNGFPEKYQGHKNKDFFFLKVSDMNLPGNETYIKDSINTIDETIQSAIRCNLFPKSTIIFAKVGAALLLNRRRILTKESCIDNNMMGLIVNKEQNFKFYFYVMQSIDFAKYVSSGALPSINQAVIGDIDVAGPPLPEQIKIADILTTVDDAIEETDRIIEKAKELKKGLMQQLLTRGIGHKKFKKTEIGEIPVDWEIRKLEEISTNITKGTTPTTYGHHYKESGVSFLRVENIKENGNINLSDIKYISPETHEFLSRSKLAEGDILFSIAGAIGRCALITANILPANINQALALIRIKSKKEIDLRFILQALLSNNIKNQSALQATSLAQTNLNLEQVRNLCVPLPSLSEQIKIAEIMSKVDLEIENEKTNRQNLETLKKSLMQVLLTGRVRV